MRCPCVPFLTCSTQYKTVLDALRGKKDRFTFEDVEISLKPSIMAFITMNPGYPGRAGKYQCICLLRHPLRCL
jgi:dynein heavy chain